VIRHPELKRAGNPCGIGVGRYHHSLQRKATTGENFIYITLRGPIPPAELHLPESQWASFLPLAILQQS
jgi:hypothetical protein